jgi:hypothetical protein
LLYWPQVDPKELAREAARKKAAAARAEEEKKQAAGMAKVMVLFVACEAENLLEAACGNTCTLPCTACH